MKTPKAKFETLAELIKDEILPEARRVGGKMPSELSLSRRYGSSTITISKALACLEAHGLIERRRGSGTYIRDSDSVPDAPSFGMRVAGAALHLNMEGHIELASHVAREIQARNWLPCLFDGNNTEALKATLPGFLQNRPFGMIVDGTSMFPFETLETFPAATRLVFVSHFEGPRHYNASYVLFDHHNKGRQAVRHLLRLGRRRIAVVNFELRPGWSSTLFWEGCQEAFREAGIEAVAHFCDEGFPPSQYERLLSGPEALDGVVGIADNRLVPFVEAANIRGVAIPESLAVIGGGNTDWSLRYDLTSMDSMDRELAAHTVAALDSDAKSYMTVSPRIVFRGSCPNL